MWQEKKYLQQTEKKKNILRFLPKKSSSIFGNGRWNVLALWKAILSLSSLEEWTVLKREKKKKKKR